MKKIPRYYQRHAARRVKKALSISISQALKIHPVVALPTGTGKSLVICMVIDDYLSENITKDVLIISHRSTIIRQDFKALEEYFPNTEIGIYSAKIGIKEVRKITVASIQSIWKKPELFNNVGLVLIDEAHTVNTENTGMYREFLQYLEANYVGLTATPFRLGHGYIYKGKGALFNNLCYDLTSTENYNKLVEDGYLSKMFSYKTKLNFDTKGLGKRMGDFIPKQLSKKFDKDEITAIACSEIVKAMKKLDLNKCLIFAIDTEHADNINKKLNSYGVSSVSIHSNEKEHKKNIRQFKQGEYKAAVSVEMMTTGLDDPEIDLLVLLRSTQSPSLHVQILGRGGRPLFACGYDITRKKGRLDAIENGGKPHCIVMDFAGNLARLGPINAVIVEDKEKKEGGSGEAITKECPKCEMRSYGAVRVCSKCGYEFQFESKLQFESSDGEIIRKRKFNEKPVTPEGTWLDVENVEYQINSRKGKPSSLKVSYRCGLRVFKEYVCIDHTGYARHRAKAWINWRLELNIRKPKNLRELYMIKHLLEKPRRIFIVKKESWDVITGYDMPSAGK